MDSLSDKSLIDRVLHKNDKNAFSPGEAKSFWIFSEPNLSYDKYPRGTIAIIIQNSKTINIKIKMENNFFII